MVAQFMHRSKGGEEDYTDDLSDISKVFVQRLL